MEKLQIKEIASLGTSAFATEDIPEGSVILAEAPALIIRSAATSALSKEQLDEMVLHTLVDTGSPLFPQKVNVQNLAILDSFVAADAETRRKVEGMQCICDPASPIQQSVAKAAEKLASLGVYALDAAKIEELLLVGRINAHDLAEGDYALFDQGRLIAHSCRPNAIFGVVRDTDGQGEVTRVGCWRALRDIAKGELITASYASEDFLAVSAAQRRHYLLCQKGFLCQCDACVADVDPGHTPACPLCRPRNAQGELADEQLSGCCLSRNAQKTPPWSGSVCGRTFTDADLELDAEGASLLREVFLQAQAGASTDKSQRNAFLAKVLRRFGEQHYASQIILRAGALRSVAELKALEPTVQRLALCHDFLLSIGWSLGMMPICGLYKAIIARAQAEAKNKTVPPRDWPRLVAAAARCAAIVDGPGSETAKRGLICTRLFPDEPKQ